VGKLINNIQLLRRIAGSNNVDPREIEIFYKVTVCQQGILHYIDFFAVIIRFFKIENLETRISNL
jgi:hypothetical protein